MLPLTLTRKALDALQQQHPQHHPVVAEVAVDQLEVDAVQRLPDHLMEDEMFVIVWSCNQHDVRTRRCGKCQASKVRLGTLPPPGSAMCAEVPRFAPVTGRHLSLYSDAELEAEIAELEDLRRKRILNAAGAADIRVQLLNSHNNAALLILV